MAAMLANTQVNAAACAAAASDPLLLATDLADYLVKKGMPFRQAHHVVGAVVALAEKSRETLDRLPLSSFQRVDKMFAEDVTSVFDLRKAMSRRKVSGAPGTGEVKRQLARWKQRLR
jgi:argininosuccinate lyase